MTGDVTPEGPLSGKISGGIDKTTFTVELESSLAPRDAAARTSCGKQ